MDHADLRRSASLPHSPQDTLAVEAVPRQPWELVDESASMRVPRCDCQGARPRGARWLAVVLAAIRAQGAVACCVGEAQVRAVQAGASCCHGVDAGEGAKRAKRAKRADERAGAFDEAGIDTLHSSRQRMLSSSPAPTPRLASRARPAQMDITGPEVALQIRLFKRSAHRLAPPPRCACTLMRLYTDALVQLPT